MGSTTDKDLIDELFDLLAAAGVEARLDGQPVTREQLREEAQRRGLQRLVRAIADRHRVQECAETVARFAWRHDQMVSILCDERARGDRLAERLRSLLCHPVIQTEDACHICEEMLTCDDPEESVGHTLDCPVALAEEALEETGQTGCSRCKELERQFQSTREIVSMIEAADARWAKQAADCLARRGVGGRCECGGEMVTACCKCGYDGSHPAEENKLADIMGEWPGDETDEELLQALKEMK